MGSFSPLERLLASVGKHVKSSLPFLRTVPSQSFTVAVWAISGGAALKASLISAFLFDVAPLAAGAPIVCPAPPPLGDPNSRMLMTSVDGFLSYYPGRTENHHSQDSKPYHGHAPLAYITVHTDRFYLFDHLVGAREQRWRNRQAQRSGRRQVDHQLQFGREFHRQVAGLGSLQNLTDESGRSAPAFAEIDPVAHQSAVFHILPQTKHGWQPGSHRQ